MLMLERHRYHYAQTLLYRPAISLLLKLQAKSQSLEVSDDGNFEGSFAQDTLRRFASKCLQAAVHTIDLLFTYRERGRKIMTPVRNFTPLCFCASKTPFSRVSLTYGLDRSLQCDAGRNRCKMLCQRWIL